MPLADLVQRLEDRREEIEEAILARVRSVEDPADLADPEYRLGLKAAVSAAVSYGLSAIDGPAALDAPVPDELGSQARRAARNGVGLDTVLRRCIAGHCLLADFIGQEAEEAGFGRRSTRDRLRTEAAVLERLVEAVTREYGHEQQARSRSRRRREVECVAKLLAGESLDAGTLRYDLDAWHVGAIATGAGAEETLRGLAKDLDLHLLCVPNEDGALWAWFGSARRPDAEEFGLGRRSDGSRARVITGEPARGLSGWRLSHRQAIAALPIALRLGQPHVRYADVALLASMLQDEVLLRSLTDLYLTPLAAERDGGEISRQTLRAYFSTQRNVSSAAAALGVSRKTVAIRIRKIEERLGRRVDKCAAELEAALALQSMGDLSAVSRAKLHTPMVPRPLV
jgi:hypothetical protein